MEHDKYAVYMIFIVAIVGLVALVSVAMGGTGETTLAGQAWNQNNPYQLGPAIHFLGDTEEEESVDPAYCDEVFNDCISEEVTAYFQARSDGYSREAADAIAEIAYCSCMSGAGCTDDANCGG